MFTGEKASGGVMQRALVDPLYLPHDVLLMLYTQNGKALCIYLNAMRMNIKGAK